jgi:hypothetical protein
MALITKEEVKAYLKLDLTSTEEDAMLDHLIAAATAEMERDHRRNYEYGSYLETFNGGDPSLFLHAYPVHSITSISISGKAISASNYRLDSSRGIVNGSWPKGFNHIEVQYQGGFWTDPSNPAPSGVPLLPADIKHECLERVAYLYENRRGRR